MATCAMLYGERNVTMYFAEVVTRGGGLLYIADVFIAGTEPTGTEPGAEQGRQLSKKHTELHILLKGKSPDFT